MTREKRGTFSLLVFYQIYFQEVPDEVDSFLASQDGMIIRDRDSRMCRHNARQKCTHCLPLDVSFRINIYSDLYFC